jgi:hypothetical protein
MLADGISAHYRVLLAFLTVGTPRLTISLPIPNRIIGSDVRATGDTPDNLHFHTAEPCATSGSNVGASARVY